MCSCLYLLFKAFFHEGGALAVGQLRWCFNICEWAELTRRVHQVYYPRLLLDVHTFQPTASDPLIYEEEIRGPRLVSVMRTTLAACSGCTFVQSEWSQSNALQLIASAAGGIACVMRADMQKSAFERKPVTANLHCNWFRLDHTVIK